MYPTFAEEYTLGLVEGKRLALMPDKQTYDSFWKSYRDYSSNHPTYTQNFEYFRGKYLIIVVGWRIMSHLPLAVVDGIYQTEICVTDSNCHRRSYAGQLHYLIKSKFYE